MALASTLETLELEIPSIDGASCQTRDHLVGTIRSYLVPRLDDHYDLPLSVVFAGPTGSGKSTLVNSLSGLDVSVTGPLRPTTKGPVILTSARSAEQFTSIGGISSEVVTAGAPILERMAFVDTPDIDSTSTDHRVIAEVLMDHADVLVFITSALRYADLVPWDVLKRAMSRGTPVIHVLNRVTSETSGAIPDFIALLTAAGMEGEIVRVPEHHIGSGGQAVPTLAVAELRRRLAVIAKDIDHHREKVFDRVLASTIDQASELASVVESAAASQEILETDLASVFDSGARHVETTGVTDAPAMTAPPTKGRIRTWRWLRKNRVTDDELAAYRDRVMSRLVVRVSSNIGGLAVNHPLLADVATILVSEVRPVIEEGVSGWFDHVVETTGDLGDRDRNLGTMVLTALTLGDDCADAGSVLFGLDRDLLVGRLRTRLRDRLEVAYTHATSLATDRHRSRNGHPDVVDLNERVADVVIGSHPGLRFSNA